MGTSVFTYQPEQLAELTLKKIVMKRLKGDMYIASQYGLVHVSPEDVTSRQLENRWPGTFVLINLNLAENQGISLESLMAEIESNARNEVALHDEIQKDSTYSVSMVIVFGQYLEDKESAIQFRDQYILPAVLGGKRVELDFHDIKTAPHSFLNALLATPIKRLGIKAYRKIQLKNAPGFVHEIVGTILEHNVSIPN